MGLLVEFARIRHWVGKVRMLIWLGKQYLGQRDKVEHDIHGFSELGDAAMDSQFRELGAVAKAN